MVTRDLLSEENLSWLPVPNRVTWSETGVVPDPSLVTSVFVFAFEAGKLLLMEHVKRGADLPGGHVEPGEHPDEAAVREFLEETGRRVGRIRPIAAQRIDLLGEVPENWKYPSPTSFQVFYVGETEEGEISDTAPDSRGLLALSPDEVRRLPWYERHRVVFELALRWSQA